MARLADAQELEVDAARLLNRGLVRVAEGRDLVARERAVGNVDVSRADVHVGEQILPHEPVVGVNARGLDLVVLIEVEGHHLREGESLTAVHVDQLAIHADGSGAGGEPQHRPATGCRSLTDDRGDSGGDRASEVGRVVQHDSADVFEVCRFGVGMHGRVAESRFNHPSLVMTNSGVISKLLKCGR